MVEVKQGYYSVLQWRRDPARDECRNVAVLLMSKDGSFGGIKEAPISSMSPNLRQQGILDSLILSIAKQFDQEVKPDVGHVSEIAASLGDRSLIISDPLPAAVSDPVQTLDALYKSLVQPLGGSDPNSKGAVIDRIVRRWRRYGYEVRRNDYVQDFIFDAIVTTQDSATVLVSVLNFASQKLSWINEERQAAHFLYGLSELDGKGFSVIEPPSDLTRPSGWESFERVNKWLSRAQVPAAPPSNVMSQEQIEELLARQ